MMYVIIFSVTATRVHLLDLPVLEESRAEGVYTPKESVGVTFDCATQNVFWVDAAERKIYVAGIDYMNLVRPLISTGLVNPEGNCNLVNVSACHCKR